jgi:anion-transporting  ArsA/GET3 family ATPase
MAMEKLYELVHSEEFDIVVVDTPPTRNALDLLDAPRRLTRFLENRLFRALLVPTRMSLRAVGVATQALLRTISKVAGAEIVQDAVGFFQAFEGMEDGFRSRASAVHDLLADPATAYVLVTSARPDAIAEASFFAERLLERDIHPAALVVNRIHPSFGDSTPPAGPVPEPLVALEANLAAMRTVAVREEQAYSSLVAQVAPAPVGRIPLFGHDVHELTALGLAAERLFA